MTPEDIEALFQSRPQQSTAGDGEEETISPEERALRTEKLKEVLLTAQYTWLSGSDSIDLIAEKLGDGSREGEWKLIYLIFFLVTS